MLGLILITAGPLLATQGTERLWRTKPNAFQRMRKSKPGSTPAYLLLTARLQAQGAKAIRSNERVSQPFFSVRGRILQVNGEPVQVFEYRNAKAAESDAERVSETGTSIAMWIAPPHFYRSGKLIVLYVGSKETTLKSLAIVLGDQFAGSPPAK